MTVNIAGKSEITQDMIDLGYVYVEIYAMKRVDEFFSRLVESGEDVDFYDISLRPDGQYVLHQNTCDPFEEWENLSEDEVSIRIALIQQQYPNISYGYVE